MYYYVSCEVLPGKEKELDRFLVDQMKKFWLAQPGILSFHIYGDQLVNSLERFQMIQVGSLGDLESILDLEERKVLRSKLMTYTKNIQSRILDEIA